MVVVWLLLIELKLLWLLIKGYFIEKFWVICIIVL